MPYWVWRNTNSNYLRRIEALCRRTQGANPNVPPSRQEHPCAPPIATASKKDAEAKFPIKIDMPVPAGGESWPFAEMLAWCHANVAAGAWAQHGHMDKKRRDDHGIPIGFARWYFMSEADAEAFKKRWAEGTLPPGCS
jgi:hypothetical protein